MVRRTKEDAEATRNKLLDAAEIVFNEKGVARTTLADIAAQASLTRGAIYWHFKDKADLFHAMLARVHMPMDEMIEKMGVEQLDKPLAFLRTGAASVLHRVSTDDQTRRVFDIVSHKCELVGDMAVARERQLESRTDCLNRIGQAINAAITLGLLPSSTDPYIASIGLHSLIDGLISNWMLNPGSFSLSDEAAKLIDIYISGLRHPQ